MGVFNRAAKLAALPVTTGTRLAAASARAAIINTPGSQAALEASSAKVIEKVTRTLADAKGPAMKFGQTLAMVSTALPPDQAELLAPLGQLYENATPRPWSSIAPLLTDLPSDLVVDPDPVAAASLGQVHKARFPDGLTVAVKVQYPDAARTVKADSIQLRSLAPLLNVVVPSLDVSSLVKEHTDRLMEELDYHREAEMIERFRTAWDPEITIPEVVFVTPTLLVTTWVEGAPLNELGAELTEHHRSMVATDVMRFAFASPRLVGASHADPHPGNYRVRPDAHLGVLDFGAVAESSGVFTRLLCDTLICGKYLLSDPNRSSEARMVLVNRWVQDGMAPQDVDPDLLIEAIGVRTDLVDGPVTLSSAWLQDTGATWSNPAVALERMNSLRFPPSYLLEHRALGGALALACSLGAEVDLRELVWANASTDIAARFPDF